MAGLLISAAHKSSGKTTLTVGLCAALHARGQVVQAFKKGPDYIDPMWLAQASGRPCFNLDPYLSDAHDICQRFEHEASGSSIAIVEGNKGLYDGLALDGSNSNAALAHLLGLPVVLVLDARGMTRGIAPLILGYQAFDRNIQIAGVILNRLGGARHESKLRAVIEHYTDVPVLGAVGEDPQLAVLERHLGLMPSNEHGDAAAQVQRIGERVAAQVDLDALMQVAQRRAQPAVTHTAPGATEQISTLVPQATPQRTQARSVEPALRIAVARDKAFGFYYPDDLQAMEALGVEVVAFDTLHDDRVPAADGVFIGGGFPEACMDELSANVSMRASVAAAVAAGVPVYAECGGLMYLCRSIAWQGQQHAMVGSIGADVHMHERPVGRGYVELQATPEAPWLAGAEGLVRGHEFHYSNLENLSPELRFAYRVRRGHGIDGQYDGMVYRNVLANYAHLRSGAGSQWVPGYVDFVRRHRFATDSEGYLLDINGWSEDFARRRAWAEGLALTDEHWQVIQYLRAYFDEHRVQAQVRVMIKHFAQTWGEAKGNNHYLHDLFPVGGPQKQGNRLAGLLKTKGEH